MTGQDPAVQERGASVGQPPSARLRAVEAERDQLRGELDTRARAVLAAEAEVARLRARLGQRDLDEIEAYDAWRCVLCGLRTSPETAAEDDQHRVIPVRVSITRRTEGPTT